MEDKSKQKELPTTLAEAHLDEHNHEKRRKAMKESSTKEIKERFAPMKKNLKMPASLQELPEENQKRIEEKLGG